MIVIGKKALWVLAVSLIILTGCKRDDAPKLVTEEPVFHVGGMINNTELSITAGDDDYYMYTSFEQGVDNVYTFSGSYQKENCDTPECPETLTFSFRDDKVSEANGSSNLTQSLDEGLYPFRGTNTSPPTSYEVQFTAEPYGGVVQDYKWEFGDGLESAEENPIHIYTPEEGITSYNVCLTIVYGSGCSSSICNDISLPNSSCAAGFEYTKLTPEIVYFEADGRGLGPIKYSWEFSAGNESSSLIEVKREYNNPDHPVGVDTTILTVEAGNKCSSTFMKYVVVNESLVNCATNFSFDAEELPPVVLENPLSLSTFEVTWVDGAGIRYSSMLVDQPSSSYFRVLNVEEFSSNKNNEKTRKFEFVFTCTLASENGDLLVLEDVTGITAVSYK